MTDDNFHDISAFRDAGFAIHWLHPRSKRPIGDGWQDAPVASLDDLRASYRDGYNQGVRLGETSALAYGGYLHVIDIDIRVADLADEAWERFEGLFPDLDLDNTPTVASGSGGESRHLYIFTDKPYYGRKLAVSEGKHRRFDKALGRDVWSYDWEIELFGTGKQVAMPPSIHPDSGKPYVWITPFDFDMLSIGLGPHVPTDAIERLGAAETTTFEFESREPLTYKPGQMERELEALPVSRIDDRADWVLLGQALHHQFGGSLEGFETWMRHSARGTKFLVGSTREKELRRYRGFGRNRRQPVTMATVRQWYQDVVAAELADQFDDLPDTVEDDDEEDFGALLGPATADDDDFDSAPVPSTLNWVSLLDLNEDGAIKPTLHNVELIVKNDPRLVSLPQLNDFTQETVQRLQPGEKRSRKNAAKETRQLGGRVWQVDDTLNGELWSDDRDFAIRSILEAPKTQGGYGVKVTDRDLKAAIVLAANDNAFHPVREYLNKVTWDGVPRAESLFIDYLGADDNAYTRSVGRILLTAAVTRIFEPGHKYDFAVIMEGLQGKRKSTFIEVLGRSWFAELDGDFHDPKQMVELMQGAWIMEIPELSGFGRADVRSIKAFISRRKDRARLAYARRAGEFPRQCIFIGSTNDREYLKDDTGGRRFWPMLCLVDEIDTARLEQNVDQIWAEAVALYRAMRDKQPRGTLPLYLTDPEAKTIAARLQESRKVESADAVLAGRIGEWLDRPINDGGYDDVDSDGQPRYRNETCSAQVWTECLGGDPRAFKAAEQGMVNRALLLVPGWAADGTSKRFATYGKQRVFYRGGEVGKLDRMGLGFITQDA